MYFIWIFLFILTLWIMTLNSAVLYAVIKYRRSSVKERQNTIVLNVFIVALCRAFVTFVHISASFANTISQQNCNAFAFFISFTTTLDWLAILLLFIDRLVFIKSPVNYTHKMTWKAVLYILSYLIIHALIVPCVGIITKSYRFHQKFRICELGSTQELLWFGFIWNTVIPLVTSIVIYSVFYNLLKQNIHKTRVHDSLRDTGLPLGFHSAIRSGDISKSRKSYLKCGKHLSGIFLFYCISWVFYASAQCSLMFQEKAKATNISTFYCLGITLSFLSDVINPFLIMRWSEVFRRSLLNLVHCGQYSKTQVQELDNYRNVSTVFDTLPPRELRGNYVMADSNTLSEASLKYFSANYLHNSCSSV